MRVMIDADPARTARTDIGTPTEARPEPAGAGIEAASGTPDGGNRMKTRLDDTRARRGNMGLLKSLTGQAPRPRKRDGGPRIAARRGASRNG